MDCRSAQLHVTALCAVDPGDDVDHGCLARAIRADHAKNLTVADLERNAVKRLQPTETFADVAHLQQRAGCPGRHVGNRQRNWLRQCPRALRPKPCAPLLQQADQSVRRNDDGDQQCHAVGNEVIFFHHPKPFGQIDDQQRTQNRPGNMRTTTQHGDGQAGDHDRKLQHLYRHHANGVGIQGPGEACKHRRQQKSGVAKAGGINADGLCRNRVFTRDL